MYKPRPAPRPSAEKLMYPPFASVAEMAVLYGDLSLLKRTSRYGRKTRPSPYWGASSASSASIGPRTSSS
jgi:hypothetical protein